MFMVAWMPWPKYKDHHVATEYQTDGAWHHAIHVYNLHVSMLSSERVYCGIPTGPQRSETNDDPLMAVQCACRPTWQFRSLRSEFPRPRSELPRT